MKLTVLIGLPAVLLLGGCATKIPFENSTVEPAAVGKVKVKKDNNNNYSMQVDVLHLGSPQRLTPPQQEYVVWVETPDHTYRNVGRINMATSMWSKALSGELKTVVLFKPSKVFITAEPAGEVDHPGVPVVLTTNSF